jgi:A-kinase anchor protein 13
LLSSLRNRILTQASPSYFAEPSSRETLLHFAARLGLEKVASYLLDKPGSEVAVSLPNHHGEIPQDIARDLGSDSLADLLSEYV